MAIANTRVRQSNGCKYCSVVWIDVECKSYIQMHIQLDQKNAPNIELRAELKCRSNNNSHLKLKMVPKV